ncbi:MAG: chloride channel protein [Cyclobacteriaceae bacterium]|nr:chloride channel protein [Cyclobacteriaceae bacterium]
MKVLHTIHNIPRRTILYLHDKLSARQFFILASIIVGISSGLAAVLLKYFVHTIDLLVTKYPSRWEGFLFIALLPLIGIALTVFFIRFFLKGEFKKGSAEISYAIAKKSSIIPSSQMYSHLVTSALTVGFGGSVGLESPMVSTGSALGSNFGRIYKLSYKERTILLACGASAGIAAAFNSPIAGVLFAIEVLLADVTAAAFIPLIISAACGALVSKIILKEGVVLSFTLQEPFNYHNVPYYIVLGILAGLLSLYYAQTYTWIETRFKRIANAWTRVLIGGVVLLIMMVVFPPLFGEGYESIKSISHLQPTALTTTSILSPLLQNNAGLLLFLGALMLLKVIAAAVTIGAGGNGGSFGPSLFTGAYLGFVFARLVNLTGLATIPETNFTLVAMAGILSGVFYAPLTAIFLIAEITGGYELMIPLMIVSAISVTVAHYVEPLSMEAKKLSKRLNVMVDDRDKYLLSKLELSELIETNFSAVKPDDTLEGLVKIISTSKRNTFPVVTDNKQLVGLIHLDNVRNVIFHHELYTTTRVKDLMTEPKFVITSKDNLHDILRKFDEGNQWNLPVVDQKQYIGFVSKSSILTKYRTELLRSV